MKKVIVPMIFLINLSIISFVIVISAKGTILTKEEAIKLGEEKYLKFLWIIDGAFNSEIFDKDFKVNGKVLTNDEKRFTCKYKKNKTECTANNFETEFRNLFSKYIKYDDVYSDGITYKWYSYKDNSYYFHISNNCKVKRMGTNHVINIIDISKDVISYEVKFDDNKYVKEFVLTKEDNEWKVSKAFYHDLCELKYSIK